MSDTPPQPPQKEAPTTISPTSTPTVHLVPVAGRRHTHTILLAFGALVLLLVVSVVLVARVGRDLPTIITTPTLTPRPELAFFPAVPTPDAPQQETALPTNEGDVLAPALLALNEGRYEDAAALLADIVATHAGDNIGAEAQWQLGIAYYDAERYDDAIASFRVFAGTYAGDARAARAAFWAGRGHLAAGRPAEALAEFESYAPNGGPLAAEALLLAAEAAGADGQSSKQIDLLNRVLQANPTRLDRVGATEQLAVLDDAAGRHADAAARYLQIAADSRVPAYRAATLVKATRQFYAANDSANAEATIAKLAAELPDQADSYPGLQLLLGHDANALDSGKLGYDVACRLAVAGGQNKEALGYCESFRDRVAPGPERADAAWYTALAYHNLDDDTQAAIWYQGFAETYPADERADDALFGWGAALLDQGDNAEAVNIFDRLLANYPLSTLAAEAQDGAAVALRRQGILSEAGDRWRLAASAPGVTPEWRARALFWWGWALQQQGEAGPAAEIWQQGALYSTFWGVRSADHLAANGVVPINGGAADADKLMAATQPQPGSPEEAALYAWLGSWSKSSADVAAARAALLQNPEYTRALALSRVELWPEAASQYDSLVAELKDAGDGATLAALMLDTARAGWPWVSYRVALGLRGTAAAAGIATQADNLPTALLNCLYPVAWPRLLLQESRERDLDPWLVLGMMRQESAFDPRAHSWADARGLLQVVPDTASAIATGLGETNFDPAQLFRPAVSIRFGSVYLADALKSFEGNILFALAGYNGGPGNVPRWAGAPATNDADLFVENIDYPETQEYLQLVYANYRMYRTLYAQ